MLFHPARYYPLRTWGGRWGFYLTEKICQGWKKLFAVHPSSMKNINSEYVNFLPIRYFNCWNVFLSKKETFYSLFWIFILARQLYTIVLRWFPRKPFLNLFKLAWNTFMMMWDLNLAFYSQVFVQTFDVFEF